MSHNLDNFDMTCYALVKKGYGTLEYIREMEDEELDSIITYENMMSDIEALIYEDSQQG